MNYGQASPKNFFDWITAMQMKISIRQLVRALKTKQLLIAYKIAAATITNFGKEELRNTLRELMDKVHACKIRKDGGIILLPCSL